MSISCFALSYGEEYIGYYQNNSQIYKDVPETHWAFNAVNRATKSNWFGGYPDGTFRPNASITRAEALKVFVQAFSLQLSEVSETSYYDIKATDWFAPYVEAGKDLFPKRTQFNGQTPFQPNMPVTREDVMYAIVKALGYDREATFADHSVLNMFSDQNSISADVKGYVAVGVSYGLISGMPDGTIGAQDPLTRAEFATLLYRATHIGTLN